MTTKHLQKTRGKAQLEWVTWNVIKITFNANILPHSKLNISEIYQEIAKTNTNVNFKNNKLKPNKYTKKILINCSKIYQK